MVVSLDHPLFSPLAQFSSILFRPLGDLPFATYPMGCQHSFPKRDDLD